MEWERRGPCRRTGDTEAYHARAQIGSPAVREVLNSTPIFTGLTDEQLGRLAEHFSIIRADKGETVFFQTEDSSDFYIVFSGMVRATLSGPEGQELILAEFAKGDFFGEISFLDNKPRSATITAAEDSVLGMLRREEFLASVRNDPTIALGLLSCLLRRMRAADEMIESFAFLDVKHRLVKVLLQAARAQGRGTDGLYRLKKITHRELAAKIGSSREAVSKALKFLSARKAVREEGEDFLICADAESRMDKTRRPR